MRLPRPRLTARRLMILVAVVGLVLGGLALVRRRRAYALTMVARYQEKLMDTRSWTTQVKFEAATPKWLYYRERYSKWRSAAASPWLPFEADPPPPE